MTDIRKFAKGLMHLYCQTQVKEIEDCFLKVSLAADFNDLADLLRTSDPKTLGVDGTVFEALRALVQIHKRYPQGIPSMREWLSTLIGKFLAGGGKTKGGEEEWLRYAEVFKILALLYHSNPSLYPILDPFADFLNEFHTLSQGYANLGVPVSADVVRDSLNSMMTNVMESGAAGETISKEEQKSRAAERLNSYAQLVKFFSGKISAEAQKQASQFRDASYSTVNEKKREQLTERASNLENFTQALATRDCLAQPEQLAKYVDIGAMDNAAVQQAAFRAADKVAANLSEENFQHNVNTIQDTVLKLGYGGTPVEQTQDFTSYMSEDVMPDDVSDVVEPPPTMQADEGSWLNPLVLSALAYMFMYMHSYVRHGRPGIISSY